MNSYTSISPHPHEIASIARAQIERLRKADMTATPWVREGLSLAHDIEAAALGVQDGLEGSQDELTALLAEWAETDPHRFPAYPGRLSGGELKRLSKGHQQFNRGAR